MEFSPFPLPSFLYKVPSLFPAFSFGCLLFKFWLLPRLSPEISPRSFPLVFFSFNGFHSPSSYNFSSHILQVLAPFRTSFFHSSILWLIDVLALCTFTPSDFFFNSSSSIFFFGFMVLSLFQSSASSPFSFFFFPSFTKRISPLNYPFPIFTFPFLPCRV